MPKKYNELTLEELRALLLRGELIHKNMEQEDYVILMEKEFEAAEPDNDVIRICALALGKYDDYNELDEINIDINELINKTAPKTSSIKLKIKRSLLIAAAITAALSITQLVAAAFGFNILGYIFNFEQERLVAEYNPGPDYDATGEMTFEIYDAFSDVPAAMTIFVPQAIIEDFSFSYASSLNIGNNIFAYKFVFTRDDAVLSFHIDKGMDVYIQKEEDFLEEYSASGKDFTIYRDFEQFYKVTWIENGHLFDIGVNLPLEEIKNTLEKF
ncbi:MAG: hypothetical protein LBC86_10435 [Oscillospiraceae bacterium]|jgi:hypothetical protein|nr:hypothetical protein [Oscillospiraceae bacterium]